MRLMSVWSFVLLSLAAHSGGLVADRSSKAQSVQRALNEYSSFSCSEAGAISIPFEAYGTFILVPVRIDKSDWLSFILDSGVRYTQVNAKTAEGLGVIRKKAMLDVGGAILTQADLRAPSFSDLESAIGRHVDGILGYDLFRRFAVEIDYREHCIKLRDPQTSDYAGKDLIAIKVRNGVPIMSGELEFAKGKLIPASLELDTGSTGGLDLYSDWIQANHVMDIAGPTIRDWGWDTGGEYEQRIARSKTLRLGQLTIRQPIVDFPATARRGSGPKQAGGQVGGQVLQRFKIVFNYMRGWVILEPQEAFNIPFEWDMSGVLLDAVGADFSTYQVSGVRADSPASDAGLKEGDTLILIDGVPANRQRLLAVEEMFKQEGREFSLRIQRAKEEIDIKLRTRRLI